MGVLNNIDFMEELDPYLGLFGEYKLTNNKLICSSPFRQDRKPSFAINLETGVWVDSGAIKEDYYKGDFIKLIALLSNQEYIEVKQHLLEKYQHIKDPNKLHLNIKLNSPVKPKTVYYNLDGYTKDYSYLLGRGISVETQKAYDIRYDTKSKSVVIPIKNIRGNIVALKFRSILFKNFWYKGGSKGYLFGAYNLKNKVNSLLYVFESEIDCLTCVDVGYPAVATMGSSISQEQIKIIKQLKVKQIVVAGDNDLAGEKLNNQLTKALQSFVKINRLSYPFGVKDINEVKKVDRGKVLKNYESITLPIFNKKVDI